MIDGFEVSFWELRFLLKIFLSKKLGVMRKRPLQAQLKGRYRLESQEKAASLRKKLDTTRRAGGLMSSAVSKTANVK